MRSKLEQITLQDRNAAEMEIRDKQKQINYDTKEYPVEILVQKYMEGINDDTKMILISCLFRTTNVNLFGMKQGNQSLSNR